MTIKEVFDGLRKEEDSDRMLWWLDEQLRVALEEHLLMLGCPDTDTYEIIEESLKDFKAAVRRGLVLNSGEEDDSLGSVKRYVKAICKFRWFKIKKKKRKNAEPVVVPLPSIGVPDGDWKSWVENLETDDPPIEPDLPDNRREICLADIEAVLPKLKKLDDQKIIRKHYLQDPPMKLVDIAAELKITYETVKKRHIRSVEKLRKLLPHYLTKQTVK